MFLRRPGLLVAGYFRQRMGNISSSTSGSIDTCSAFVNDVVSGNCVVIFSKSMCPYSNMAKKVFDEIGAEYHAIELDQHKNGVLLQDVLGQMTGARTVPRVFINGQCIGGGTDTSDLHKQGKLVALIDKCAMQKGGCSN